MKPPHPRLAHSFIHSLVHSLDMLVAGPFHRSTVMERGVMNMREARAWSCFGEGILSRDEEKKVMPRRVSGQRWK